MPTPGGRVRDERGRGPARGRRAPPRRLGREGDQGAEAAPVRAEVERPAELVADERADDREARPGARLALDPAAVVGDREHDVAVQARELDAHRVAAVLEGVLEQLREDE